MFLWILDDSSRVFEARTSFCEGFVHAFGFAKIGLSLFFCCGVGLIQQILALLLEFWSFVVNLFTSSYFFRVFKFAFCCSPQLSRFLVTLFHVKDSDEKPLAAARSRKEHALGSSDFWKRSYSAADAPRTWRLRYVIKLFLLFWWL